MAISSVLITGASSGLGRALALWYARAGWQVFALARSAPALQQLVSDAGGAKLHPLVADLTEPAQLQAAIAQISERTGQLDLAVLNAGSCEYVDAGALDLAAFERTFALNVLAQVRCIQALLPLLRFAGHMSLQRPPQLALVSSLAWHFPFSRAEAYGASKAALSYLADSLRLDLAADGIAVCLIEPGFVDTPLTRKNDFAMPFLLSADDAAGRIAGALAKGSLRCQFPRRLVWSLRLLNVLPYRIRQRVALKMAGQQPGATVAADHQL